MIKFITLFFILFSIIASAQNTKIENFRTSKKVLPDIHKGTQTIYCPCDWDGKKISLACNIKQIGKESAKRNLVLEWEHIVPMSGFSHIYADKQKCGKRSSRLCARKTSAKFNLIEADLFNLYPAIGSVNGRRSDLESLPTPDGSKQFSNCDAKFSKKSFEPGKRDIGIVARGYLYMNSAYDMKLDKWKVSLYEKWDNENPPRDDECQRYKKIKSIQGNDNKFLAKWCLK